MEFKLIQLLSDFGLVVLIFIVQLIIYPAFRFYEKQNLNKWHTIYTQRIALLVIPLMFAQLGLGLFLIVTAFSLMTLVSLVLISSMWILTFVLFVPYHSQIANETYNTSTLQNLVNYNWLRTIGWSLLFGIHLWDYVIR